MSAGVARQYTGTAGRVENAQVGVFLAYAASDGARALTDRELYLPKAWTGDRDRCRAAGIADDVPFATKPELAWQMIGRAADAGVPFCWVTGDEVYGGNPKLRQRLEERQLRYVMAVACSEMVSVPAGSFRADALAALVPAGAWERLSCADGSKGPRLHDWALLETADAGHWLLARRSLNRNAKGELELAFFRCWSPGPVTLPELVAVAGALGNRGLLFRGQERDRPGPLPGPQVPGLVPARHPVHARPRVPRRHRARHPARARGQRKRRRAG
jgi:SRSO17 transposase